MEAGEKPRDSSQVDELRSLADEQAALRRVATLVAGGAEPAAVFSAVCEETGPLVGAQITNLDHFRADGSNTVMAGWSVTGKHVPAGTEVMLEGGTITDLVQRHGNPQRMDDYEGAPGELAALIRELGIRSEVGAPVIVDGVVWGALIASTDREEPLPPGTEFRLAHFAELAALAIANAATRAELIASRARIVAAADEGRRRLGRDLHDGAQQRFVNAMINLQLAEQRFDGDPDGARDHLRQALGDSRDGLEELRELAAGLHPSILTNRGLGAAARALAGSSTLPVAVGAPDERYPAHLEAAAYFLIAEALANVAKHAEASRAEVEVSVREGRLVVEVRDDGRGGASRERGSGIRGLEDRVDALGGEWRLESLPGEGTRITASFSLADPA